MAGEGAVGKDSSIEKTIEIITEKITKIVNGIEEELNNKIDREGFDCYC